MEPAARSHRSSRSFIVCRPGRDTARGGRPGGTMTTTIVRGGRVLDVAGHRAEPADLRIEGDTIREIGRPGLAAPAGARVVDAHDRLLMPGLVNAHTHAHGGLGRGSLGDRVSLE